MGLKVAIKGYEGAYDCGYITYHHFLMELIKAHPDYDDKCYEMYEKMLMTMKDFTKEEVEYWNAHCNDDLDILIWHSDAEGKFTPQECKKIYNAIKDLKSDMLGHNYGDVKTENGEIVEMPTYNMFERWKDMFRYCAKRRVNMYYQ